MVVDTLSSLQYAATSWPEPGTSDHIPVVVPARLAQTIYELNRLAWLPVNWNSYGAIPVRPDAIRSAIRVLAHDVLEVPPPTVTPTARGGVQLEWGRGDDGVEVEIQPDGGISALVDVNGTMDEYTLVGPEDPSLSDIFAWAAKLS